MTHDEAATLTAAHERECADYADEARTCSAVADMVAAASSYDDVCRIEFIVSSVCADYVCSAGAPPGAVATFRSAVNRVHDSMVRGGINPDTHRAEMWRRVGLDVGR